MITTDLSLSRRLLVSVATLIAVALGLYVTLTDPFASPGLRVTADFGHAGQGLAEGSPVKVRGVTVGSVASVRLDAAKRARLTLRLNDGARIPAAVIASIEPASVFGPKFVNLIPGGDERSGPFLADRAHIARTSDPTDLGDMLGAADKTIAAIDPGEVSAIVRTLAQGLGGQETRLRGLIDNTGTLLGVADRHRADARRFLADSADLTGALARAGSGERLAAVMSDANTLIPALAAGHDRLGRFADQLSSVSSLLAYGLGKRGGQLGEAFRSGERAVAVIYAQHGLGDAIRTVNGLLPLWGQLTAPQGPAGRHMLGGKAYIPSNPCELILGLCGPGGRR